MNITTLRRWALCIVISWIIITSVCSPRPCCSQQTPKHFGRRWAHDCVGRDNMLVSMDAVTTPDTLTFLYAELDTIIISKLNLDRFNGQEYPSVYPDMLRYICLALKRGHQVTACDSVRYFDWNWNALPKRPAYYLMPIDAK
jgi:hypothetical protein